MTTDQLNSFIPARPFRPFRIHMADGRTVDVNHPEWIAYASGRIALVAKLDDSLEVVNLLLVEGGVPFETGVPATAALLEKL